MAFSYTVLALIAVSFLVTVTSERILLPVLRRRRAAQPILEIGPSWHLSKSGTPTLGGLVFPLAVASALALATVLCLQRGEQATLGRLWLIFLYALLNACIGVTDDLKKLSAKRNKGLSAAQKFLLQLLAAGLLLFLDGLLFGVDTAILLPLGAGKLELGIFYYPLALLLLCGIVNAMNLTDGVDGLLSATTAVAAVPLILLGVMGEGAVQGSIGGVLLGTSLGFLCFNAHPAKVFMGDTGSLFLGGLMASSAILTRQPIFFLILCGVFVIETGSVALQVIYFKLSGGKRLLRMAPLHHHFERLGFGEWQVVALFACTGALLAALAVALR